MAHFFIDRPIFSWVIAIIIMLAGAIALKSLPIAQYPSIASPSITIAAVYPGASAKTIEDTVTQVVEQKMKGLDGLEYMNSTSDSSGQASINLTFEAGTDIDIAQVQVQNKLQLAMPSLPESVQRQGVTVSKSAKNFLLVVGFVSSDPSITAADISDYISSNIEDTISRLPGVGETTVFGAKAAMRIWCDPDKFRQYTLMPSDVVAAISAQNAQVAGGQVGAPPYVDGQQINLTVNVSDRFENKEQFENIILRSLPSGANLYLKDVARVEIGSENYGSFARYNGQAASAIAIKLATGANALETSAAIKNKLKELSEFYPAGLKEVYPFDTTPFVQLSIEEVFKTLGEAILLVFLVMYLFLQDFRATLIPTIAVPVVLLGTFGVLAAAGFSINTLTMFAMVLAIGLLVDDAIVVVENVERIMREEGLSPKEAAKKSMNQITGALVGIGMVLSAVFIPMAFFAGSTGVIYRQFSITIVSSMAFSVLVAIIFTPALCATILRPHVEQAQQGFFGKFNRWFDKLSINYQNSVAGVITKPIRYLLSFGVSVLLLVLLFFRLPTGFLPDEDQGILFVMIQLKPGSTFEETTKVLEKVEQHFLISEKEVTDGMMTVAGFSFAGNGQNNGMAFVRLKDWSLRKDKEKRVKAIADRASAAFSQIKEANAFAFMPPAVLELGNATGFDFQLQDMSGKGHIELSKAGGMVMGMIYGPQGKITSNGNTPSQVLMRTYQNGQADVDQINLEIDIRQAGALGVSVGDINQTLGAFWGSAYINDFMDKGRTKKVYLQADAPFRMQTQDFSQYFVRNNKNEMVPVSNFVDVKYAKGSPRLERYNGVSSLQFLGQAAPGKSSGEAMAMMEEIASKLPPGFGFSWSGLSYQEKLSGAQAPALYALSILVVFLCLAALYESWSIPLSVILVVPFGVLGALLGASARGLSNDVYFQVGLLAIIGLSAKNAILIVEFAKDLVEEGHSLFDATLKAVHQRLRPIIMTSLAFVLGVLPLAISTGAGAGSQNAIGTAVVCGTVLATILGLFFTPLFFVSVSKVFARNKNKVVEHAKGDAHE